MELDVASRQYVLAELERIDVLIQLRILAARQYKQSDDPFQGLYISDAEVDALTAEPAGLPRWAREPAPQANEALAAMAAAIEANVAASRAQGTIPRLVALTQRCGLARLDVEVLLVCLAPELDLRYERIFAYLQDDVTRRRPSVDLVLNLLCPSFDAKLAALARFAPGAPLLRHHLVELFDDPSRPRTPLLGRQLKVDERIGRFLLGSDEIEPPLRGRVRRVAPRPAGASLVDAPALAARIEALAAEHARERAVRVHVEGPRGVGKQAWAEALCARLGLPLLVVDGEALLEPRDAFEANARLAVREAALQGAALYWDGVDALVTPAFRREREALLEAIAAREGLTLLAGTGAWEPAQERVPLSFQRVTVARPTHAERALLWTRALEGESARVVEEITVLASKLRLTGREITVATAAARDRARGRATPLAVDDLYAGCHAASSRALGELAQRIPCRFTFGDIVLPPDALTQLREICSRVRLRAHVLESWGFDGKLSLGRGTHAIFSGPSGTGKTMAAEIVAGELDLELYKIDLSGVVSKYIGETEKNLARIFSEAEATNAILFFDEADALFGKRSEVKDAHDRYANVETSYLLQRIEEYEGVTILATNLRRNMDDAFMRRMAFSVQFPFPEEAERLRIWSGVWPKATPRADDLDLPFLASQFKLAGGNIKNVALGAAFLAAAEKEGVVSMRHLVRATRRELQKMGKSDVPAEFGPYVGLLEG
jgi:MoxR-like ATPase